MLGDGGEWTLETYDTNKVKLISRTFSYPKQPEGKDGVGVMIIGGGSEIWTFNFTIKGVFTLSFLYHYALQNPNKRISKIKFIVN